MIKINLLVERKGPKKKAVPKEFIVLFLCVALLIVGLFLFNWKIGKEKEDLLNKISNTKNEINHYKSFTTEVSKAKEDQKILQDKLNVINSLRKEKGTPAKVLDELSMGKPEKIHLESLKKEGTKLGIEGIALDDETVANFMTNLRKSKLFKNIELIVSEQVEQSKIKLKKFSLSCEINL
ncbi:MAG: PilN domain-containing protein [Thermodesulfobacteriota bacterium]